MTFLELVNKVLLRLRESPVATVQGSGNSNMYARLIGEFVNEAKAQVESAWDWSALRSTLSATTTAGVFNYELNGSGNNFKVLDVVNDTSNSFMQYRDAIWFDDSQPVPSEDVIETLKQQRLNNWISAITTPPVVTVSKYQRDSNGNLMLDVNGEIGRAHV